MKGLLADINAIGQVEYLVQRMQAEPWTDFWQGLGLVLKHFEDLGLSATSSDAEIWQTCQAEQLILITDNRNLDSADSLEAAIRECKRPDWLPVFTSADLNKFRTSRTYADRRVLEMLFAGSGGAAELEVGRGRSKRVLSPFPRETARKGLRTKGSRPLFPRLFLLPSPGTMMA